MLRPGENAGVQAAGVRAPMSKQASMSKRAKEQAFVAMVLAAGLSSCTFLLDFDKPIEAGAADSGIQAIDGGAEADALPSIDAGGSVTCAAHEPNDILTAPSLIAPSTVEAAICPDDDVDFYQFSILEENELSITLGFTTPGSDLNMRLYNDASQVVVAAVGTDGAEQITRGPTQSNPLPAGDYRIEVFSATGDATVDYDLTLAITAAATAR